MRIFKKISENLIKFSKIKKIYFVLYFWGVQSILIPPKNCIILITYNVQVNKRG